MQLQLVTLLSLFANQSLASSHVVHEKRDLRNPEWSALSRLPPEAALPLRIGLKQQNLDQGPLWLHQISHPASPDYGRHWNVTQVRDIFKPADATIKIVHDWLQKAGIDRDRHQLSPGLNWLQVETTVAEAEQLLAAEYQLYEHRTAGTVHIACDQYSIPRHVREHVDFISPGVHFDAKTDQTSRPPRSSNTPQLQKRWRSRPDPPGGPRRPGPLPIEPGWRPHPGPPNAPNVRNQVCNTSHVEPACLRLLYNVPAYLRPNPSNSLGIVEYTPQAYNASDLDLFFSTYSKAQVGDRPIFDSIDGGFIYTNYTNVTAFDFAGESNLDLQYSMSLVYPQPVTLYQVGDLQEVYNTSFNNFLDAIDASYCTYDGGDDPLYDAVYPDPYPGPNSYQGPENCGTYAPAKVISTSYGYNEYDLPSAYEIRQCYEYMKLGLLGTTFLFSSGDYGVSGNGGQCLASDGSYNDGLSGRFLPSFPNTCPYVLSVGATQIANNTFVNVDAAIRAGQDVEVAMEIKLSPTGHILQDFPPDEDPTQQIVFSSGGGFSDVFALPDYQAATVQAWWAAHDPGYSASQFNNSRRTRGQPDISANGAWYSVAVFGRLRQVFGTSASSPTVASLLTLINGQRLNAGKSTVGFVNPVLYAHPEILHDITVGANPGCGTRGFSCVKGWDPVTGLGTPNFPKMLELFMRLP